MKLKVLCNLALLAVVSTLGCKTKQQKQSDQETIDQCNATENYAWHEGNCIRKSERDRKIDQASCQEKAITHVWINEECVAKDDIETPRERCEDRGDGSYWHVDENKVGTCIGPTTIESNREACVSKQEEGYKWDPEGNRCLSIEAQNCENGGDHWSYEGKCITPDEKACIDRQDGSTWQNGACISADEVNCNKQGSDFVWKEVGGIPHCSRKGFFEYCKDSEAGTASNSIKHTVSVIRATPGINNDSCLKAYNDLKFKNSLDYTKKGLSNLAPLSGFTELKSLVLQENQIKDISPIESLYKLRELNLTDNQVSDLNPLKNLGFLEELLLSFNEVSDLTPLAGMESLTHLFLSKNRIKDIKGLVSLSANLDGGLKNLVTLDISDNCEIKEINGLLRLSSLRSLVIIMIGTSTIPSFPEEVEIIKGDVCQ
ncbi:MAG: leucine-rich repeat domain-containing protein [Oligoflexales bacterium]|nr:leucine-rich repeat domain-containing protein [Oligoflexales bacterium]